MTLQVSILRSGRLGGISERQQLALDVVEKSVQRTLDLLEDLSRASRTADKLLPIDPVEMDLSALVGEAVSTLSGSAVRAGVHLETEHADPVWLRADPARLNQVVENLVTNAVKFTPPGGSVTISVDRAGDEACLVVRDTGHGMGSAQLGRIFRPFVQVHDQRLVPGGSGLGLYISREIVERHGGTISASSDGPGTGSVFLVRLPCGGPAVDLVGGQPT